MKLIVECDALYSDTRREAAVKKLMRYPARSLFLRDEPLAASLTIARMMNASRPSTRITTAMRTCSGRACGAFAGLGRRYLTGSTCSAT